MIPDENSMLLIRTTEGGWALSIKPTREVLDKVMEGDFEVVCVNRQTGQAWLTYFDDDGNLALDDELFDYQQQVDLDKKNE